MSNCNNTCSLLKTKKNNYVFRNNKLPLILLQQFQNVHLSLCVNQYHFLWSVQSSLWRVGFWQMKYNAPNSYQLLNSQVHLKVHHHLHFEQIQLFSFNEKLNWLLLNEFTNIIWCFCWSLKRASTLSKTLICKLWSFSGLN